jgi:hypothetical protein
VHAQPHNYIDIFQTANNICKKSGYIILTPFETLDKSFAWSRGIGVELSPLQTRSARKKKDCSSTQLAVLVVSTQDGKALRAMKAIARSK